MLATARFSMSIGSEKVVANLTKAGKKALADRRRVRIAIRLENPGGEVSTTKGVLTRNRRNG